MRTNTVTNLKDTYLVAIVTLFVCIHLLKRSLGQANRSLSMATTVVHTDLLAVAFIVESSTTIADEWSRIFQNYIGPMVQRLSQTYPTHKVYILFPTFGNLFISSPKFCIAFVCYGTADSIPSPLLCKKYFSDPKQVIQQMKENTGRLGIGRTNSGGSRGMAALEGFVAALEVIANLIFDQFQPNSNGLAVRNNCLDPRRPAVKYISCVPYSRLCS